MSGHVSLCAIHYKSQGNKGQQFQIIVRCFYQMNTHFLHKALYWLSISHVVMLQLELLLLNEMM